MAGDTLQVTPTRAILELQIGAPAVTSVFGRTGIVVGVIGDYAGIYQPLDGDLTALAALASTGIARRTGSDTWTVGALVSYAELVNATGQYHLVARTSAAAGAWEDVTASAAGFAMLQAASANAQATLLPAPTTAQKGVVTLGVDVPAYVVLGADIADSTGALVDSGLTFTPDANSVYHVEFYADFEVSATTTGLQWQFVTSGQTWGTAHIYSPTSGVAQAMRLDALASPVLGTGTAATTNNPAWGWCLIKAGASPAAIKVQFRTEVAASAVTLKAGSFMRYKKIA